MPHCTHFHMGATAKSADIDTVCYPVSKLSMTGRGVKLVLIDIVVQLDRHFALPAGEHPLLLSMPYIRLGICDKMAPRCAINLVNKLGRNIL